MRSNLSHLRLKTRSLGEIKEISCGHAKGHISFSIDLKIGQNKCFNVSLNEFEFGSPGIKKN